MTTFSEYNNKIKQHPCYSCEKNIAVYIEKEFNKRYGCFYRAYCVCVEHPTEGKFRIPLSIDKIPSCHKKKKLKKEN